MRVILDTCVLMFIDLSPAKLSETARKLLVDPESELLFSAISVWECSVKHSLGKVELSGPPDVVLPKLMAKYEVDSLSLTDEDCYQVLKLPRLHSDPFDRMLICQAIAQGIPIVTPDPQIQRYPVRTIW